LGGINHSTIFIKTILICGLFMSDELKD